jgi:hypothetical protein
MGERLIFLGGSSDLALVRSLCDDDDLEDSSSCDADFMLFRVFETSEDILLLLWCVDSGIDFVRLRVRDCSWGDETGDISRLV